MTVRRVIALLAAGLFVLLAVRRFVPAVPLALIPHESVAAPDPAGEPVQRMEDDGASLELPRARLRVRAWLDISGQVQGTMRYWMDGAAWLIPWDLALAWGDLVEEPYRSSLRFHQNARFVIWGTEDLSLDRKYIVAHSANVHVIPATSKIARALQHVRRGDLVRLEGELVEIEGSGPMEGFRWRTSLSRTDTDAGSCETIYLRRLNVGGRLFE